MAAQSRILMVSAFAGQGGTGRWLSLALPELAKSLEIRCILKYGAADMSRQIGNVSGRLSFGEAPIQSPKYLFGLWKILLEVRGFRPGAIIVHHQFSMVGIAILRLFGCLRRVRILLVIHSVADEFPHVPRWKRECVNAISAFAMNGRDRVIAVSENVRRYLDRTQFRTLPVVTIRNGYRVAAGSSSHPKSRGGRLRVGYVGRLSIEKGADRVPLLVNELRDCPIEWHIAGAGALQDGMLRELQPHLEAGRVTFHGWISDAPKFIDALDVMIIVSRTEGCPFVVLEAQAVGTLVLSLAVGGMPEVLDCGEAGIVVEDLDALSDTLRTLSGSGLSQHAARISRARRLLEDRYSLDGMIGRYIALIHERN
jgi:glycosyltransferase involved in cell wall biosynthesis